MFEKGRNFFHSSLVHEFQKRNTNSTRWERDRKRGAEIGSKLIKATKLNDERISLEKRFSNLLEEMFAFSTHYENEKSNFYRNLKAKRKLRVRVRMKGKTDVYIYLSHWWYQTHAFSATKWSF